VEDEVTSAVDLATTVIHPDDPLVPGATKVQLAHVAALRDAGNAVRSAAGLAPFSFSAPPTLLAPVRASN